MAQQFPRTDLINANKPNLDDYDEGQVTKAAVEGSYASS